MRRPSLFCGKDIITPSSHCQAFLKKNILIFPKEADVNLRLRGDFAQKSGMQPQVGGQTMRGLLCCTHNKSGGQDRLGTIRANNDGQLRELAGALIDFPRVCAYNVPGRAEGPTAIL
ncbi:MAG: hypothetical protein E7425_04955 [Ruminococcaceae bacterium]|nr:hypothetical protein [Oscillospiraceae bacterium]